MCTDRFWWKGHEFITGEHPEGGIVVLASGELHPDLGFYQLYDPVMGEHGKYAAADLILDNYVRWSDEFSKEITPQ